MIKKEVSEDVNSSWGVLEQKVNEDVNNSWGVLEQKVNENVNNSWGVLEQKVNEDVNNSWGALEQKVNEDVNNSWDALEQKVNEDVNNSWGVLEQTSQVKHKRSRVNVSDHVHTSTNSVEMFGQELDETSSDAQAEDSEGDDDQNYELQKQIQPKRIKYYKRNGIFEYEKDAEDDPFNKNYGILKVIAHHSLSHYICKCCKKPYVIGNLNGLRNHVNMYHKKSEEKNYFICEFCAQTYDNDRSLRCHVKVKHHGEIIGGFTCKECGFEAYTKLSIARHMKNHINVKKVGHYQCDQCTYESKSQKTLYSHMQSKHLQAKVVCPWEGCGKAFCRSDTLKFHMFRHTGEKPFICDHCDYRAIQQGALLWHMKKHHPDLPYQYTHKKALLEAKKNVQTLPAIPPPTVVLPVFSGNDVI